MQNINLGQVGEKAGQAVEYLFYGVVIWFAYMFGRDGINGTKKEWGVEINQEHTTNEVVKRALKGVLIIVAFAVLAGYFLGTETSCTDSDPIRPDCETTTAYEPSSTERVGTGVFVALLLGLPYLYGVQSKYRYISSGRDKKDHQDNLARIEKIKDEAYKDIEKMEKIKGDS